jgi:hypothetical protein
VSDELRVLLLLVCIYGAHWCFSGLPFYLAARRARRDRRGAGVIYRDRGRAS